MQLLKVYRRHSCEYDLVWHPQWYLRSPKMGLLVFGAQYNNVDDRAALYIGRRLSNKCLHITESEDFL